MGIAVLVLAAFDGASDTVPEPQGNNMSKLMIALFATAGLVLAGPAAAQLQTPKAASAPMSKDGYVNAKADADARYKADKDACSSLAGNAKDICVAEAKGRDSVAKAEAEASYENTPKARESAHVAHVQASYDVSMQKCDDLAGNRKDVCAKEASADLVKGKADAKVERVAADTRHDAAVKQAKAAHVKALADAKVDRVAADTRNDAAQKTADAQRAATEEKRDADYKVAIEKCDALAGPAKDACASNAMVRYGKT